MRGDGAMTPPRKERTAEVQAKVAAHDRAFDELVQSIQTHGACQCDTDHLRPTGAVLRDMAMPPKPTS